MLPYRKSHSLQENSSHLSRLVGLTPLTLRLASWSESAFFLFVCRGSGGSHWPRYGLSNQRSSCRQQSACFLVVLFALCLMSFFILRYQHPDRYGLFYDLEIGWCFSPLMAGSVLLCWFTKTFCFFSNIPPSSHSHNLVIKYYMTTWLKILTGRS